MIKYISILLFIIKMTDNKNIEDFNDKLSDIGYFNFEKYEEKFLKKFGKNENIKKYYEDFE